MKKILGFTLLLMSVTACAAAQQQQTPLGDVVKQNKPARKAARVITDEDMPSHPQPAEPAPSAAADTGSAASTDTAAKPSEDAKDPKAAKPADEKSKDSAEVLAIKSRLKELDMDIPNLQRMLKGTDDAAVNSADPERRAIFENASKNHRYSLQHAMNEKQELNDKLQELKKAEEAKAKADQ